jgi:membrane protein
LIRRARHLLDITGRSLWRGLVGFYRDDNLTFASSIAYYALLSIFPFLLLALSALGAVTADEAARRAVLDFVIQYFPARFEFLSAQLDAFRATRLQLGVFGALALAWAARGVFGAVSTAVNHAWGVEKQRSYLGHQVFSFLMLMAAGVLLLLALVLVSAVQVIEASWFATVIHRFPALLYLRAFAIRHIPTVLLIGVTALIYYFVPNTKVRFSDVWIGSIITGLLLSATTAAFSWYVRDLSGITMIHGSIATAVVFMGFVYVLAVILLYGAEFTVAFSALRRETETPGPPA